MKALSIRNSVGLAMLAALSSAVLTASASGARQPATTPWPAPTGLFTLGVRGWQVQSSARVVGSGTLVSAPGYRTSGWLKVRPDDGGAPGTEIEALLQNGACPRVFYGENMRKCFGYEPRIGPDTVPRFAVPWWFRTDFRANLSDGQVAQLVVNGVVGAADVWLDGHELATNRTVSGDYTRFSFDVTGLLRRGLNALALEVDPNDPFTMYTLDDVDWNQIPPDNNTGIQFPIQLRVADAVELTGTYVTEQNAADLSTSAITIHAGLLNTTARAETAVFSATVLPPAGGGSAVHVTGRLDLPPHGRGQLAIGPHDDSALLLRHPQIWWPYQMGGQPLYRLHTSVRAAGGGSDVSGSAMQTFGVRTVTTYLIGASHLAPHGVRVFAVNGRPFVIRGGGWSENLFLHYSAANTATQITLIKSLGLNVIRTEGKEMPSNFYQQMDRAGVMIDGGFQCCDIWGRSSNISPHDYGIIRLSAYTIGENLRNHPSVINFSWSDNAPSRQEEAVALAGFSAAGFQDPIVSSAEYNTSPVLGWSGEKEGPYDWVPPSYWYDTTHSSHNRYDEDPTLTNVGGSWGFDSEESAGDSVATLGSLRRFMSPHELAELWKNPAYNQYHANYEPGHTGYAFGTLFNLDKAIAMRYGSWGSLDQYVEEAQVQNYEDTRAQFEAFLDHSAHSPTPATGTIYWQVNKGWPTLLWDLYNYDFDEAGSYFGAKKANEDLHVMYAPDSRSVTVDNVSGSSFDGLSVRATVYGLDGRVLDRQVRAGIDLPPQGVATGLLSPRVPPATRPPRVAKTYFIELVMYLHGAVVDRNVYWLSTQPDVVNWPKTEGSPQGTLKQYANLRELRALPMTSLRAAAATERTPGSAGHSVTTTVTLTNPSSATSVAFFARADILRGRAGKPVGGNDQVLPVTWTDNDITLWPGESETLVASYPASALGDDAALVSIGGWNVASFVTAASTSPADLRTARTAATERGVEHFGLADGAVAPPRATPASSADRDWIPVVRMAAR